MGEFEETSDSENRVCPYCGYSHQPDSENYSEDRREEECDGCGKWYHAEDNFSIRFVAVPDCELNDETHNWKDMELRNGRKHPFCTKCGQCQPIQKAAP